MLIGNLTLKKLLVFNSLFAWSCHCHFKGHHHFLCKSFWSDKGKNERKKCFSRSTLIFYNLNFARVLNYSQFFQAYLYTNPLGEIAAKSGVVINRIHFSPTDHIIAFSGMVSGQGKLGVQPQFTAPVYVYKNKVTWVSSRLP